MSIPCSNRLWMWSRLVPLQWHMISFSGQAGFVSIIFARCDHSHSSGTTFPKAPTKTSPALAQHDVRCAFACDDICTFIAQGTHVDAVQQVFAATDQDRAHGQMQLINQPSL